jgi:prophage regulatory protein
MNEQKADRILRDKELDELTGTSRTTRWRLIKKGEFPAPVQISDTTIGWRESVIQEWIRSRPMVLRDGKAA